MKHCGIAILAAWILTIPAYGQSEESSRSAMNPRAPARAFLDVNNNLNYEGPLDFEATEALFSLYDQALDKPQLLVITSAGGNVQLGLDIGEWVHKNQLDVLVDEGCASSCANYIFTAARIKYLRRHSVLIWHGGASQSGLREYSNRAGYGETWSEWQQREERFYRRIGVDPAITVYGQDKYSFLDYAKAFVLGRRIAGFDYSIDDMEKFGVSNIELVDGEWDWREHNSSNVKRVEVEE